MDFFKSYKQYADEELMALIQQGNEKAFAELYKRYSKRLLHFMLKMLNNDEEKAQDILQELFLKIVERPERFDTNRKFYSWVFTVAANMCRTSYRNSHIDWIADESETQHLHNDEVLIETLDANNFNQQLYRALHHLTYEQKETFILRFQQDFKIEEIAEMMNCSVGTVKSRIYYTTRKLAAELHEFKSLLKK